MLRSKLLMSFSFVSAAAISMSAQIARDVAPFVSVDAPVVVLNHVTVIDGTGAAPKEDQAVVIADGKIKSIGQAAVCADACGRAGARSQWVLVDSRAGGNA